MNGLAFYEDLLGLPDFQVTALEKTPTKLTIHGRLRVAPAPCPVCQQPTGVVHQTEVRQYRDLKISAREVWLHVRLPQFHCVRCGRYFSPPPRWVAPGKSYTLRQAKWVFELCEKQSFTQVAALVNMAHTTVERLSYAQADAHIDLPARYAQVRQLGLDEVSHRKGKQAYVCVLTDLERGIQLAVLPDRRKATLLAHFHQLSSAFCQQITAVACDMWPAYLDVIATCCPYAYAVIDRFHVVKQLNHVLDQERKTLLTQPHEGQLTRLKWALFKRADACKAVERDQLRVAFAHTPSLARLYELRESFHALFDQATTQPSLVQALGAWQHQARQVPNTLLTKFSNTLTRWGEQIANFAHECLTNAATEGLNNYLRYIKRISFGLPNFKNMRLRILVAST